MVYLLSFNGVDSDCQSDTSGAACHYMRMRTHRLYLGRRSEDLLDVLSTGIACLAALSLQFQLMPVLRMWGHVGCSLSCSV